MSISINGKTHQGNNVSIINDRVFINGVEQTDANKDNSKILEIIIEGSVGELTTDASVIVNGNVSGNVVAGGSVRCDVLT